MIPPLDILYVSHNRREFTEVSLAALRHNTNWKIVRHIFLYDDMSTDGTFDMIRRVGSARCATVRQLPFGGPVAAMNYYLNDPETAGAEIFAKIDSDTVVPKNWLDQCLSVMMEHQHLDLLGIEPPASRTPAPWSRVIGPQPEFTGPRVMGPSETGYAPCDAIGGIGLMRRRAFTGRPPMRPYGENGVGGFTDWQFQNPEVKKGWMCPPLNLFLLDRLPFSPWTELSDRYIKEGNQRPWTRYPITARNIWAWSGIQVVRDAKKLRWC